MTDLRELIQNCKKCPLNKYMEVSPVPPEWSGNPCQGVMCILSGPLKSENDYIQEVITGINRAGLLKILKDNLDHYYITPLIKCKPNNSSGSFRKQYIKTCRTWITEEIKRVNPSLVLGFGRQVKEILSKSDVPPWIKCDYYLSSVNNVINNKQQREFLIRLLQQCKVNTK